MVLERLYSSSYIKKHKPITLLLGIAYAICGISFALFLFPDNPAPMSIAFISLFAAVSLSDLLIFRENIKQKNRRSLQEFFKENKDILFILSYLFIGILFTFAFFSIFMPTLTTNQIFSGQVNMMHTLSAKNIFDFGRFNSIFSNNLKVLLVCIFTSFLFGISTIFLLILIWNASVIGVIFGLAAKNSVTTQNPFFYFLFILIAALPHIGLEISSYLFAGVVGDKFSQLIYLKGIFSSKGVLTGIMLFLLLSFILLILAAIVETAVTPHIIKLFL